jgi:adenylyltransferase/sulfurtransferase
MLTKEELIKYQRQIILPEIGVNGQLSLKNAKILMVGAGGLGCPVLQYLAAAGVGEIGIIDHDVVEVNNLHRQVLFTPADIGLNKAIIASTKIKALNPSIKVESFPLRLVANNCENILKNYDLVIDGSDNFETKYLVNDVCVNLNKTLIFGAIHQFEGRVSVFNYQNGPNYRDVYPEVPKNNEIQNCAEIGVINTLPAIIGAIMANEAIKIICQMGDILSGKMLLFNVLDYQFNIFKISAAKDLKPKPEDKLINEISLQELNLKKEDYLLVDVREEFEFEEFNLGGINIPLYNLLTEKNKISREKDVVFCCQTGQKSKIALEILKPFFKQKLFSLKNGLNGM